MKIFLPVSLLLPTASIFSDLLIVKDSHVHAYVCVCFYFIQSEYLFQYLLPVEDAHTTEADIVYISFSTSVTQNS